MIKLQQLIATVNYDTSQGLARVPVSVTTADNGLIYVNPSHIQTMYTPYRTLKCDRAITCIQMQGGEEGYSIMVLGEVEAIIQMAGMQINGRHKINTGDIK